MKVAKRIQTKGAWNLELEWDGDRVDSTLTLHKNGKEVAWGSLASAEQGYIVGENDQDVAVPERILDWAIQLEDEFYETQEA